MANTISLAGMSREQLNWIESQIGLTQFESLTDAAKARFISAASFLFAPSGSLGGDTKPGAMPAPTPGGGPIVPTPDIQIIDQPNVVLDPTTGGRIMNPFNPTVSNTIRPQGGNVVTAALMVPKLARALMGATSMVTARQAVGMGAFMPSAGGILSGIGAVLGINEIIDFLFPDEPNQNDMADMIEELAGSGQILVPPKNPRFDDSAEPSYFTLNRLNAQMWLHYKYHSGKSIAAVKRNERTPRYTSRPRPRGRSRRS